METNAAGQNFAQAMEDGFHRRLLDQRSRHIEQGSIPAMGAGATSTLSSGMSIRLAPTGSIENHNEYVSQKNPC